MSQSKQSSNVVWKTHPKYHNLDVSTDAQVRSVKTGRLYHPGIEYARRHKTYVKVTFRCEGVKHTVYLHRLVAETHLGDAPPGKTTVNHIDGDIYNNHLDNLEWASTADQHAHKTTLAKPVKQRPEVVVKITNDSSEADYDPSQPIVAVFYMSIEEAMAYNNVSRWAIRSYLRRERKQCYNVTWMRLDEFRNQFKYVNEEWRPAIIDIKRKDGTEESLTTNYTISNMGRARNPDGRLLRGQIMDKYVYIHFMIDGESYIRGRSTVVMRSFVGPRPEGCTVDHINRVRDDDGLSNLRYATAREQSLNQDPEKVQKSVNTRWGNRKVQRLDAKTGEVIAVYDSGTKAAIILTGNKKDCHKIYNAIRMGTLVFECYWRYAVE
jgi:HNH endonuclease